METVLIIAGGILIGCMLALSWFAGSDAPYIPTKVSRVRKILKLAGVKKGKNFYELGSGDGRVAIEAGRLGANSVGIEQSLIRVLYSRWKASRQNSPQGLNCQCLHGDIFKRNYHDADIIYIFLLQKGVNKLEEKLKKELKKGSKIITQTFHFKNWKPIKKVLITEKNSPNTLLGKNQYEGDFRIYRV